MRGIVKWFNLDKGFGIISCEGKEYFVHKNETKCKLRKNNIVEFDVGEEKNKICAKGVKLIKKIKNTESFKPIHEDPDMRIKVGYLKGNEIEGRDVIVINNFFPDKYTELLGEVGDENTLKMWHGQSHFIADDSKGWKEKSDVFNNIIGKIAEYFNMDIKATRFNWYKNSDHWKPYHHDAAAVKPHIAEKQNFTVGVSFGAEREISFEHAKTKTRVSFALGSGTLYAFGKDINIEWKHGVPQLPQSKKHGNGRISIIAWGKI